MLRRALSMLILTLAAGAHAAPATTPPATKNAPASAQPKPLTPELLLTLAAGKPLTGLADLIDPALGLLFMDHFNGPGEGGSTIEDRHVCPADVAAFVAARGAELAGAITDGKASAHLRCAQLTCQVGGAGEWDPVVHFTFGVAQGKRVLRAIAIDDEVLVGADTVAAEHAQRATQLAHLARCR